jgi:hypothetical protein
MIKKLYAFDVKYVSPYLTRRNLLLGLLGLGIFSLLFLLIPGLYSNPSGDDYCFASITNEYGFLGAQVNWYTTWTGRFFSSFILSANPLIFRADDLYFAMITLNLVIFVGATYIWWRKLILSNQSKLLSALFTCLSTVLYLGFIPYPQDTLFWAAGTITYLLPLSLALLASVIVANNLYRLPRPGVLVGLTILLAGITGSNETFMAVVCLSLAAAIGIVLITKRRIPQTLVFALLMAGVFSAFVYFAPGNDVRTAAYAAGRVGDLRFTIKESLFAFQRYILNTPFGIFGSFALLGILAGLFSNWRFRLKLWFNPVIIGALTFVLAYACFAVSYWGAGEVPPLRTFSVIQAVMCLGALGIGVSATSFYTKTPTRRFTYAALTVSMLILTAFVWTSPLHTSVRQDLSTQAYTNFKAAMDKRDHTIYVDCAGQKDCVVDDVSWPTAIDRVGDITADPNYWVNECVATYYNLENLSTSSL